MTRPSLEKLAGLQYSGAELRKSANLKTIDSYANDLDALNSLEKFFSVDDGYRDYSEELKRIFLHRQTLIAKAWADPQPRPVSRKEAEEARVLEKAVKLARDVLRK